ncbi:unnamed protein product [Caenorhabditis bovis]|uniref:Tyrosine-protein phosphatase domain-containing protein n=1 Tax=Caenorhabditis bovis TaxID=2654633 RepID=A0A8S1F1R5_9PELO|nr:unnamed protein product [Caenorhabditis bovis]
MEIGCGLQRVMDTKMDGGRAVALSAIGNTSRISTRSLRKKKTSLLTPKKFIEHVQSKHSSKQFEAGVAEIFKEFYPETPTFTNFFKKSNKDKNAKPNIWLYDSTRVVVPDVDYYHASYVDGASRPNEYILAQAPFNAALQKDFFKLLQHVKPEAVIIADGNEEASAFILSKTDKTPSKMSTERSNDDMLQTALNVGGPKSIKLFKLTKFDDKPPNESEFLDTHERIRKNLGWNLKGPIVVVCKDGATKSGIFVLLDMEAGRLKEKSKVRLTDSIKSIRNMRSNTFDTIENFEIGVNLVLELCKRAKK